MKISVRTTNSAASKVIQIINYLLKIINHHDAVNRCVVQAVFDRPALVAVEERGMMSMAARVYLH